MDKVEGAASDAERIVEGSAKWTCAMFGSGCTKRVRLRYTFKLTHYNSTYPQSRQPTIGLGRMDFVKGAWYPGAFSLMLEVQKGEGGQWLNVNDVRRGTGFRRSSVRGQQQRESKHNLD